jgi:hypothetical protein
VDANKEVHVALAARLGTAQPTLNITVNKDERHWRVSGTMWKVLWSGQEPETVTISRTQELLALCFKEATGRCARENVRRPRFRQEDNFKVGLTEIWSGGMNWNHLAYDRGLMNNYEPSSSIKKSLENLE